MTWVSLPTSAESPSRELLMLHPTPSHRLLTALAALTLVGVVGACTQVTGPVRTGSTLAGSGSPTTSATPTRAPTTSAPPPVRLTPNVTAAAPVPVDTVVSVSASNGTVSDVVLTYQDPQKGAVPVEGKLRPDGTGWVAGSLLAPGATYSLTMTGSNPEGVVSTQHATFSTQQLSKKQLIYPTIVGNGATVGVAMPVIVHFDVPVQDKAAFEKRMTVVTVPPQAGAWSWVSSNEAHWRPVTFWQPGTKVAVSVDVSSVAAGNGTYGQMSVKGGFTVGQSVIMRPNLATHQMTVEINGAVARTIPITGGKAGFDTRSGTKVIMEKFSSLHMDAATLGIEPGDPNYYNIPDVRYAMRETYSGEFLHAAPWSVASQGTVNISHGCVGMNDANAAWLFGIAKVGDPVVTTGTSRGMEPGNGWTDWNVSFPTWQSGSALKH